MHRSSISVWKVALSRDPLPPKPADLNEPQYINLAFSEHCHDCLASGKHIILWTFRTRLCPNCLTKDFVYSHTLNQFGPCVPIRHLSMNPGILRNDQTNYTYIFSREEVRALANDLELAETPVTHLIPALGPQVDDVLQQRVNVNEPTRQFAELCRYAEALRVERIRLAEEAARAKRTQQIFERLYDLGYKDEVAYLEDDGKILSNHSLLKTQGINRICMRLDVTHHSQFARRCSWKSTQKEAQKYIQNQTEHRFRPRQNSRCRKPGQDSAKHCGRLCGTQD